jgi:Type I phosphodiesterase / nucleotide pyrophosphatase
MVAWHLVDSAGSWWNGEALREDVERLHAAFASGELVHPIASVPGLVDLARSLASLAGVPAVPSTSASAELAAVIGPSDHLVFVLIDGLGANALEAGAGAPFLRAHLARRLLTPFPSTTAVALTSLATGAWPAQHGVTGWWMYLPEIEATVTPLPFTRRGDDRDLGALGITTDIAFPLPSMWTGCPRDVLHIQPNGIAGTAYSTYQLGRAGAAGYGSLREAFDLVRHHAAQPQPTFTYLYLPHVDAAAHQYTMQSPEAQGALANIDAELASLASTLGSRVRIVLTSDHGHAAVPEERRHRVRHADPLASCLRAMPAGDMRATSFHVRPDRLREFEDEFRARFGAQFALLSTAEIEAERLLGPEPPSAAVRERLGDFTAVSLGADIFGFIAPNGDRRALQQPSHHSGLTPDEMLVPLVIA